MSEEKINIDPSGIDIEVDEVFTKISSDQALCPCEKTSEKNEEDSSNLQHFAAYAYYGQHIAPLKETWVQFTFFGGEEEDPSVYNPKTRNRFVLIVFSIVFVLLLITAIVNVVVHMTPSLLDFFQSKNGQILAYACLGGWCLIGLAVCFLEFTYYPPVNYIVLILSVVFISGLTSFATANTKTTLILYAIGATIIVVSIIMGLACTAWDFTKFWNFVMVGSIAVAAVTIMIYAGMAATGTKIKTLMIVLAIVGTFVQSVVLLLVLQSILGGKTVVMSENLYIIAAYEVYTSIISIFLRILSLLTHVT